MPAFGTLSSGRSRIGGAARPWPLFLWLAVQLLSLFAAASRFAYTPRFPAAGERLAVEQLVTVQLAASALLFPWLLGDVGTAVAAVLSGGAFVAFAGALAAAPVGAAARAGGYVAVWATSLAVFRFELRSVRSQLIASSIIASLVLGGPLLWYLRAEFAPAPAPPGDYLRDWLGSAAWSPMAGAVAQLQSEPSLRSWAAPAALLAVAGAGLLVKRGRKRAISG